MPGFEDLVKQIGASVGGPRGSHEGVVEGVVQMLSGPQGAGLTGLVRTFQDNGLGDVVRSWVSSGPNLPISASQLQQALGSDTLNGIAAKAGLETEAVTSQLALLLPALVDKLTPDGKVPGEGLLDKGFSFLK